MNDKTATTTNNEETTQQEQKPIERKPLDRDLYADELTQRSRAMRDEEMEKEGFEVVDTTKRPEETVAEDENTEQLENEVSNQETETEEETSESDQTTSEDVQTGVDEEQENTDETMVTIKVDGVEQQVPESKIREAGIRELQKESAADRRLSEATKLLNEAKSLQKPQPDSQKPTGEQSATLPANQVDAEELARAIQYGTDEESVAAVKRLLEAQGRNTATLSQEQIQAQVASAVEFQTAMDRYKQSPEQGGFADIFNDPELQRMAVEKENAKRKAGDNRPYWEVMKECGDEVRGWLNKYRTTEQTTTVGDLSERRKKKAGANPPRSAQVRTLQKKQSQVQKPKTQREKIEEMKRARGQI